MGFGLLLIGYFFAFVSMLTKSYYFFGDVVGGLIMLFALSKLRKYDKRFDKAVIFDMIFTALSAAYGISFLFGIKGILITVIMTAKAASVLAYHIFLFWAISKMAQSAEDRKLSIKSRKAAVIISVYYFFYIVEAIAFNYIDNAELKSYLEGVMYVYGVICVIVGFFAIYSAFSRLFVIGEERREPKPSKIPLINKIRHSYYESKVKADEENYSMIRESYESIKETKEKYKKKKKKH